MLEPDPEPSRRYQIHIFWSDRPALDAPHGGPAGSGQNKVMRSGPRLATFLVSKDTYCLFSPSKSSVAFRVDHFVHVGQLVARNPGPGRRRRRRLAGWRGWPGSRTWDRVLVPREAEPTDPSRGLLWLGAWDRAVVSTAPYLMLYLVRGMTAALHCRGDGDMKPM